MDATPHDPATGEVIEGETATIRIGSAAGQLKSIVERIERLNAEVADLQEDIRDIYKEAKSTGFDPAVIRKVIAERKKDGTERQTQLELFKLYWQAVN